MMESSGEEVGVRSQGKHLARADLTNLQNCVITDKELIDKHLWYLKIVFYLYRKAQVEWNYVEITVKDLDLDAF